MKIEFIPFAVGEKNNRVRRGRMWVAQPILARYMHDPVDVGIPAP